LYKEFQFAGHFLPGRKRLNQIRPEDFFRQCKNKEFWSWGKKHHQTWKYCEQCGEKYEESEPYCKPCNADWEENKQKNIDKDIFPVMTLKFNDDLILEKKDCCFTHIIGLPVKDFKIQIDENKFYRERTTLPIFDWQKPIYEAFMKEQDNLIIKSTGLGGSALKLRHTAHQICSGKDYNNTQVPIIVGPQKGMAQDMLRRFKALFPFEIKDNMNTCKLNNCELKVLASRNIDSLRSLENPREIFFDEFDFFPENQKENVLDAFVRYGGKSGAKAEAMTTPNKPFGICYTLEENPMDFKIMKLPYAVGYGSIYSFIQIELQKRKHGFDREYNLMYGGKTGNYFDEVDINATIEDYPLTAIKEATTVMGIDSGWSSSWFAIVIMSYVRGKIYVMHCERWKNPHSQFMLDRVAELKRDWFVYKILTDGSDPQWIYSLKSRFKDTPPVSFAQVNVNNPYDYHHVPADRYIDMKVIPTSFTRRVMQYLNQDKNLLKNQNRVLRLHPSMTELKNALHEVYVLQGQYKKETSPLNDYVDAFSECVDFFTTKNIIKLMT